MLKEGISFSSFKLRSISVHPISPSKSLLRVEVCCPQIFQPLSLYIELYDCEENVVAVAFLTNVEVKEGGVIAVDIPFQQIDRSCKARVSLFSGHKELWSTEARIVAQRY